MLVDQNIGYNQWPNHADCESKYLVCGKTDENMEKLIPVQKIHERPIICINIK